jgi:transcriptional regulator with PAS, ATPase and Fis domain
MSDHNTNTNIIDIHNKDQIGLSDNPDYTEHSEKIDHPDYDCENTEDIITNSQDNQDTQNNQNNQVYEAGDIMYDINSADFREVMMYFSDIRQKYTKLKKKIRLANHKKMNNGAYVKLYNLKNDFQKISNDLDDTIMAIDEECYYKVSNFDLNNMLSNHIANQYVDEHMKHIIQRQNKYNTFSYCSIL